MNTEDEMRAGFHEILEMNWDWIMEKVESLGDPMLSMKVERIHDIAERFSWESEQAFANGRCRECYGEGGRHGMSCSHVKSRLNLTAIMPVIEKKLIETLPAREEDMRRKLLGL